MFLKLLIFQYSLQYPGYQDRWHATLNSKRDGRLSGRFSHDLALVKLREDAPVNQPFCNSICLTSQMMPSLVANVSDIDRDRVIFTNNNQCWVAGWGDTKGKTLTVQCRIIVTFRNLHLAYGSAIPGYQIWLNPCQSLPNVERKWCLPCSSGAKVCRNIRLVH